MGFFSGLSDRVTSLFISDEDKATAAQVAAGQQAILDRQYREGVISDDSYEELSGAVDSAGSYLADEDERLSESDLTPDLPSLPQFQIVPTWLKIVAVIALVVLAYYWFNGQKRTLKIATNFAKGFIPGFK